MFSRLFNSDQESVKSAEDIKVYPMKAVGEEYGKTSLKHINS